MFKSFRKKGKSNKKGSMLTLVLVIVAMALVFITSAVMITNSTRVRYYDNVLSGQARLVSTAVAESFCSALEIQEIKDEDFKNWCGDDKTATFSLDDVPGLGEGGTTTTVKFDESDGYLLATFTTTIGEKSDGTYATENCTVYFKKKPPVIKARNFKYQLNVGDQAKLGGLDIGAGHDPGEDNMCFFHGDTNLTQNAGNTVYSDIIATGKLMFGNATEVKGQFIFSGPDAGLGDFTGQVKANNLYFISPDGYAKGNINKDNVDHWDFTGNSALIYNFKVDGKMGQNQEVKNYAAMSGSEIDTGRLGSASNNTTYNYKSIQPTWNTSAGDEEVVSKFNSYVLERAKAALTVEEQFAITDEQVEAKKATFFENVPEPYKTTAKKVVDTNGSYTTGTISWSQFCSGTKGVCVINSQTISDGTKVQLNLSNGPYILVVKSKLVIEKKAFIECTNGSNDTDENWLRIILLPGAELDIGADESEVGGLKTADASKPHCYVYGLKGTSVIVASDGKYVEGYFGLYGAGSMFYLKGKPSNFFGRVEATNCETLNANNAVMKWAPEPMADVPPGDFTPATSEYEVVRFRFFY